jgi:addiction module HigA family antidote
MPMKNPPHPGDFVRTEIIEPAGLSVTAAATVLRVSRPALSNLLNGRADLSGDMALRIEKRLASKWIRLCGCRLPTTSLRPASVRTEFTSSPFSGLWKFKPQIPFTTILPLSRFSFNRTQRCPSA